MSALRNLPGLSSSSLGLGSAAAKAAPATPGVEKVPKKVNNQKLVSGKIATMTTKATDCMAWTSKVMDSTSLSLSLVLHVQFFHMVTKQSVHVHITKIYVSLWFYHPRSDTLRNGFKGELDARAKSFNDAKGSLEQLYASCLSEESIKKDPSLQGKIDSAIRACDAAVTAFNGTIRSIKSATES